MFFTFAWHLALAAGFMIILYLIATYTSLRHELSEVKRLEVKVQKALQERVDEKQLAYYKKKYKNEVKRFMERKNSLMAKPILHFAKDLNQTISAFD